MALFGMRTSRAFGRKPDAGAEALRWTNSVTVAGGSGNCRCGGDKTAEMWRLHGGKLASFGPRDRTQKPTIKYAAGRFPIVNNEWRVRLIVFEALWRISQFAEDFFIRFPECLT
ncbi:MAG: hypothetical protein RIE24_07510 [Silicimonas sp.]